MKRGWIEKFREIQQMVDDHMETMEEEREAAQQRQTEILRTVFATPLAALKKASLFLEKRYNFKIEEVEPAFVGFLFVSLFFIVFLGPELIKELIVDGILQAETLRLDRLVALALVLGIPSVLLFSGKRSVFKGNLTAMRLVHLDGGGNPVGRESAMTRQDMEILRSLLKKPARMFTFRNFGSAQLGVLVEKDYKRACTLYLSPQNKGVLRAGKRMWWWSLSSAAEQELWALLVKYQERLGENPERTDPN